MPVPGTAPVSQPQTQDALAAVQSADLAGVVADRSVVRVDRKSHPFLLRHHVSNWELATEGLEAPMLLPEIVPHVLMPGAGGIRTTNRGEVPQDGWRKAVAEAKDLDWHYIPSALQITDTTHLPAGVIAGSWIRGTQAQHTKTREVFTWYHTPWDVPIATPRDSVQRWRFDRAAFNRWRLHLVLTGVLPKPLESVIDELRARYAHHVSRAKGSNNPDREHKKNKIDAAEAAFKALTEARVPGDESAPAPVKAATKGAK